MYPEKNREIHRKTPASEPPFNKMADQQPTLFFKKESKVQNTSTRLFLQIIFQNFHNISGSMLPDNFSIFTD